MSSVAERDPDVDAVLLAVFDTAVRGGLDDVPRPADPDFAGAPGFGVLTVFGEGLADEGLAVELGEDVAAPVFGVVGAAVGWDGPGCAVDGLPAVLDGPVVWALTSAGGGGDAVFVVVGGVGAVIDEFDGDVPASGATDGGVGWFASPWASDGAVPTCDGWPLGGPPTWCESSSAGAVLVNCCPADGAWSGGDADRSGEP